MKLHPESTSQRRFRFRSFLKTALGLRARGRSALRRNDGQSLAEFSMVVPTALLLTLGIMEFGQLYQTKLTLRHAVREAARFAVTGSTLPDPQTGNPLTRAQSIVLVIQQNASRLNIQVDDVTITPPDGGGPEQIVTVQATHQYVVDMPLVADFFTLGHLDFTATTAMRNEPFFN